MADIARLAGVSTSTVSRALSGSPVVNEETRTRITELARSLNYTINIGAKNLRLQQNRTVAVVVPYDSTSGQNISDPFFLRMLGSVADALTERGFDMLLSRVDAEQLDSAAALYDGGRAVGIILIGQWHHHDQLNELAARQVPLVVWGAHLAQQLYCTVGGDNFSGGEVATNHLIDVGRRRIAFLGDVELPEVAQRHAGYREALARHRLPIDPGLVVPISFVAERARAAVQGLIDRKVGFDAIFACSDVLAMTAVSTLRENGLQVPNDVAVVGYDDIELAAYFNPPLSTVRQLIDAGGRALVDSLFSLLAGKRELPKVLPTELIIRATSGPQRIR
ncbi:MAG: LacI family DNA-binding transcriptional regulator [Steroidobacteraceae bacterium]|nr:LacI family DNA-binding transcriptional regulator [Steroidobacteraceae bacterium]